MKQNISLVRIVFLVAVLALAAPLILTTSVEAATPAPVAPAAASAAGAAKVSCSGDVIAGICFPQTQLPKNTIEQILLNFMNWLFGIFAFLAIISFIISGIQYFMATGNPDMAKKAKANMIYSIIGVVVALSSLVIIYAVEGFLNSNVSF
jgi:small-conductance mechanosensitive channel